jgi:hypothetical protein
MARTKADRLEHCKEWQKLLDKQYSALRDQRKDALAHLEGKESIVAVLENRSKVTTTDMQDAINKAKPDILETIAGIDEPMKLDPDQGKWVEQVKKLQVLGNVMIRRKNKWFRICNDFLDDSMSLKFGCIKYRWLEEVKETVKTYDDLEEPEFQALLQKEGASLESDEPAGEGKPHRTTKIKYRMEDEYVRLDAVPAERIKFPLDTKDFADAPMVIEDVVLYEHEYIKLYGQKFFDKVKEIKEALDKEKPDPIFTERFKHLGQLDHFYDKNNNKYKAYECYFWEEGKPWVMTWVGDEVAVDEENKYGKAPYRGGSAFLVAHALLGKDYMNYIGKLQEERTYLKRQIVDIISQNNFRRYFADIEGAGMNIDDYENNSAMNALIRCTAPPANFIMEEKKMPLSSDVLNFWEMLNVEKDEHLPTPRAYTGIEGGRDERTYRGKQLKVNQASKQILMMMRAYMEEVFGPLFQDILDCLAKFMKKKTVVRYLDEDYDIDPEDVICKYALIVNVGLGSHDKQDLIVKLQQLIGLGMKEMQTGIITAQNLYYMNSELVKAMGFLNTTDFVTDPQIKQLIVTLIQEMSALFQVLAGNPQTKEMVEKIVPGFMQTSQKILSMLGIMPKEGQGGENAQGTQPGELPAEIPEQSMNPMNPQERTSGGGYFA